MKYIKQLDSLRAIAVILVIISHWLSSTSILNVTPNGQIGVDIFFVLSGFLITGILLQSKGLTEQQGVSRMNVLKVFYWRRTLRIFPAYYLIVLIIYLIGEGTGTQIRSSIPYYVTYTSNFYFFIRGEWDGMLSHLWSLAVEEQFYLIWPFLILFINGKYLRSVILIFIAVGIFSQYLLESINMSYILTFTCFDGFGFGALLAWQVTYQQASLRKFYKILSVFSMICVALFILGILQKQWLVLPLRTLVSVISLWLITYLVIYHQSEKLRFKFIFNNKQLLFLGKISYGIYLLHNLVPVFNTKLSNYFGLRLPASLDQYGGRIFHLENALLLLIIAWLSYISIEKYFLKFKPKLNFLLLPKKDVKTTGNPDSIQE